MYENSQPENVQRDVFQRCLLFRVPIKMAREQKELIKLRYQHDAPSSE